MTLWCFYTNIYIFYVRTAVNNCSCYATSILEVRKRLFLIFKNSLCAGINIGRSCVKIAISISDYTQKLFQILLKLYPEYNLGLSISTSNYIIY